MDNEVIGPITYDVEALEKAYKVAEKLLGREKATSPKLVYGLAGETLEIGFLLEKRAADTFFRIKPPENIAAIAISSVPKGRYAWFAVSNLPY